jgi:carboxymethylenebutenolidase
LTIHQRPPVDRAILELYNDYAHGRVDRRTFISKGTAIAGGISAAALLEMVMPNYAMAQQISFTDARIKATYVEYPSPQGSGMVRGYLVRPAQAAAPVGAVLVVHENRGLNPYIEDVARRAATQGFIALAPDGLSSLGGYPGNDDDGRTMQQQVGADKLNADFLAGARWLKTQQGTNGMLGATGFCFGGGVVNRLAVALGPDMNAGVPFYGAAAPTADVPKIKAAMLIQYAETDEGINRQRPEYEAALKAAGVRYEMHTYPGTMHGFHNDSTPRFNREQAKIAEDRMWAHFKQHLTKA